MPLLHIALQEGFTNDTVSVRVNGTEVARRTNVTTRNQIGFAEAIELDIPQGEVQLELRVESRSVSESTNVRVAGATYMGVTVERDGRVRCEQSLEPFRYL
jgi:hypothetical protein